MSTIFIRWNNLLHLYMEIYGRLFTAVRHSRFACCNFKCSHFVQFYYTIGFSCAISLCDWIHFGSMIFTYHCRRKCWNLIATCLNKYCQKLVEMLSMYKRKMLIYFMAWECQDHTESTLFARTHPILCAIIATRCWISLGFVASFELITWTKKRAFTFPVLVRW